MAFILKQAFGLVALQAAVLIESGRQRIEFRLEFYGADDGRQPELAFWSEDASLFNPTSEARSPSRLASVARRVAARLAASPVPSDSPLWLHLVKPYGWLGALPWERELEAALDRPVLRLPDFIEKAQENPETLDVAVCSDLPDGPGAVDQLNRVIGAILQGSPRPKTTIHVFARSGISQALRSSFRSEPRVWVAPPPYNSEAETSPWLTAMCDALRERSIDVVNFVCRGAVAHDRPSLCFTDPGAEDSGLAITRSASTAEIASTLIKLGAWAAVLTLPRNASDMELRWFADSLAQARPGAVLYDDEKANLAQIYGFLFAKTPVAPPRLGGSFLYCQPSIAMQLPDSGPSLSIKALGENAHLFLKGATAVASRSAFQFATPLVERISAAFPRLAKTVGLPAPIAPRSDDATPTWVAAAQRYVEASALDLLRKSSADVFLPDRLKTVLNEINPPDAAAPEQAKTNEIVTQTLSELQEIVARYAQKKEP